MSHRWRRGSSDDPEVNLTPLIDVVFLLLIFFMVSTTFERKSEIELELPDASLNEAPEQDPRAINVQLDATGRLFVDEIPLADASAATLRSSLRAAVARQRARARQAGDEGKPALIISADASAPVQSVVTVLDVARQLGLTKISFPTQFDDADARGQ